MAAPLSDQRARQFAEALILHGGRQRAAAIHCGYPDDASISQRAQHLARNPKVLRILQPMASAHLASMTPQAIQTLAGLLTNKSGYIRLEAAKDILNRNGVGAAPEQARQPPLVIRINLGDTQISDISKDQSFQGVIDAKPDLLAPTQQIDPPEGDPPLDMHMASPGAETPSDTGIAAPDLSLDEPTTVYASLYANKPGGPKLRVPDFDTTLSHDFSSESIDLSGETGLGRLDAQSSEALASSFAKASEDK